jgi:hypothetical protein
MSQSQQQKRKIEVGDLVKRFDIHGSGTGILYRVIAVSEPRTMMLLRRKQCTSRNHRVPFVTRNLTLKVELVMFEAKLESTRTQTVSHAECDVEYVDILALGLEYNKLSVLAREESRK